MFVTVKYECLVLLVLFVNRSVATFVAMTSIRISSYSLLIQNVNSSKLEMSKKVSSKQIDCNFLKFHKFFSLRNQNGQLFWQRKMTAAWTEMTNRKFY